MDTEDFIKHESSMEQVIQTEGILCKGFGIIPKFPMLDTDLNIIAKGIYAYFCSLAGNGTTSFPSVRTILKHLCITESTYYKYYSQLISNGYITAKQERKTDGIFGRNIITLVTNPKKFDDIQSSSNRAASQVRFKGLKSSGFGLIPRYVMFSEKLDIKAKSIYAYFCSFSGSNDYSFPERKNILYHLNLSKDTYYKNYKALLALDYIVICQRRVEHGRLSVNDYILNEFPNENIQQDQPNSNLSEKIETLENTDVSPCPNLQGTVKTLENTDVPPCPNLPCTDPPCTDPPCTDLPCTDLPCTVPPCTIKQGTNTNNETINITNINRENTNNKIINSVNSNKENKNKTTINSTDILSLTLSFSTQKENERMSESIVNFESLSYEEQQRFIDLIADELYFEDGLPYAYKAEPIKMELAIKYMTGYKDNYYEQSQQQDTFDLFIRALTDLCTFDGNRILKGSCVTYSHVIKELNKIIKSNKNGFGMQYSLESFSRSVMATFNAALGTTVIKNYVAYIQSCIWDAFATYKVKETNFIKTDEYINF